LFLSVVFFFFFFFWFFLVFFFVGDLFSLHRPVNPYPAILSFFVILLLNACQSTREQHHLLPPLTFLYIQILFPSSITRCTSMPLVFRRPPLLITYKSDSRNSAPFYSALPFSGVVEGHKDGDIRCISNARIDPFPRFVNTPKHARFLRRKFFPSPLAPLIDLRGSLPEVLPSDVVPRPLAKEDLLPVSTRGLKLGGSEAPPEIDRPLMYISFHVFLYPFLSCRARKSYFTFWSAGEEPVSVRIPVCP